MGLSAEGTRHALGIAASRAGSLLANVGTMTKCAHCGSAAAAGLESAMLAETGFTANQSIFEAPKGIAEIFFPEGIRHEAFLAFGRPLPPREDPHRVTIDALHRPSIAWRRPGGQVQSSILTVSQLRCSTPG
jgi:hypothetical protein